MEENTYQPEESLAEPEENITEPEENLMEPEGDNTSTDSTISPEGEVSVPVAIALSAALSKIEAYVPTQYMDYTEPDIDAEHLNHAEQAIMRVTNLVNGAVDVINNLQSQVTQINSNFVGPRNLLTNVIVQSAGVDLYDLDPGIYDANMEDTTYLPYRYGTLCVFFSGRYYGCCTFATTNGAMFYRQFTVEGSKRWCSDWNKVAKDYLSTTATNIFHRNHFRGENLGSFVTAEQYNEIKAGTFNNLFVGDYWLIDGVQWRIVDIDYWYPNGDINWNQHHLVIMPDSTLYATSMNDTNTTVGGYVGSKMYTQGLNQAKQIVNAAFGSEHILNHREYLINAVLSGVPSGGVWVDSTVEIPNESMIYGCHHFAAATSSSDLVQNNTTIDNVQLSALSLNRILINPQRVSYWTRDIVGNTNFTYNDGTGITNHSGASRTNLGVRPVFGIKGI